MEYIASLRHRDMLCSLTRVSTFSPAT